MHDIDIAFRYDEYDSSPLGLADCLVEEFNRVTSSNFSIEKNITSLKKIFDDLTKLAIDEIDAFNADNGFYNNPLEFAAVIRGKLGDESCNFTDNFVPDLVQDGLLKRQGNVTSIWDKLTAHRENCLGIIQRKLDDFKSNAEMKSCVSRVSQIQLPEKLNMRIVVGGHELTPRPQRGSHLKVV